MFFNKFKGNRKNRKYYICEGGEFVKEKIYEYIEKYSIYVILGLTILILIVTIIKPNKKCEIVKETVTAPVKETKNVILKTIKVDIKGAVVNPGVYEVKEDSRVSDVIFLAGGYTESANTKYINLSKKVVDEMTIIIYTADEIKTYEEKKEVKEPTQIECICPDTINDACINESKQEDDTSLKEGQLISLNNATQEELETLPGIGSAKALIIIEYRTNKKFETIEEIKDIKGIGEAIFEKLKDKITI